jgi:hypothetical protein
MSSWANRAPQKRVFRNVQPEPIVRHINTVIHPPPVNTAVQLKSGKNIYPFQYNIINGYRHRTIPYNDDNFVRKIKFNCIEKLSHIRKIVCVYKLNYKNFLGTPPGLGDFIRGCMYIYQLCNLANKEFDINVKHHPIGKYFSNDNFEELDDTILDNTECLTYVNMHPDDIFISATENIIQSMIKQRIVSELLLVLNDIVKAPNRNGTVYISFISFPIFEIIQNEINYIGSKFQFNSFINESYNSVCKSLNITSKMYNVIHLRCGDNMIFKTEDIGRKMKFLERLTNYLTNYKSNNPIVLLADSEDIKKFVSENYTSIRVYDSKVAHFAYGSTHNEQGIIDTLTDISIISNCANIISYTNYSHGSGFAIWPAILNNIPYTCEFIK